MILEIKNYPNPVLKRRSEKVKEITQDIRNLSWDMVETMTGKEGLGLAAPQVGELKRIIVVYLDQGPGVFINPKILRKSKEQEIIEEGCLSFPGLFLKIKRSKEVEIGALNLEGEKIQIKSDGLLAKTFQHEIDHLDGILFIDRIGFWQRWKIRKKLKFTETRSL